MNPGKQDCQPAVHSAPAPAQPVNEPVEPVDGIAERIAEMPLVSAK